MVFLTVIIILLISMILLHPICYSVMQNSDAFLIPSSNPKDISFSARLIDRPSLGFPFYDPKATLEDTIRQDIHTSLARSRFFSLQRWGNENLASTSSAGAPISGNFFMNYSIGTPPVDAYGYFDTGSAMTWLQCLPCQLCYEQPIPYYDSTKSSTYQNVSCQDPTCALYPPQQQCSNGTCSYNITYMDTSHSIGVVSRETLTLNDKGNAVHVEGFYFGCGKDNQDVEGSAGVVGLNNSTLSLVRQLGVSQFSYFVAVNSSGLDGWIHFGNAASLSGASTPFLSDYWGSYFLSIEGISVGGERLNISGNFFNIDEGYGLIIDSGTTYTILNSQVFEMLKQKFMVQMKNQTPKAIDELELCYEDVTNTPEIVFHFTNMDFVVCPSNTWVVYDGLHCLAMLRDSSYTLSIFGVYQQRNVNVGHDLVNNVITLSHAVPCPAIA